jgi:hypothetical protein
MPKKFLKFSLLWGLILWVFGYVLGMIFFPFVPNQILGWVITPFGIALTLWVLFKKATGESVKDYFYLALTWTVIAVALDYLFIVKALKPQDGYYKPDVYFYYAVTFVLPLIIGFMKTKKTISTK